MIWYLCSSIVNFCAAGPPSPARPSTPQSRSSPVPPPPPPRPSSRPKLPPGKPISDLVRTNFPIISLSLSLCLFIFLRPVVSFTMLYKRLCLQARPFSPPVSGSPPPFAPLARAESSSSISSITSQSAASTPTLGRDLSMTTAGTLYRSTDSWSRQGCAS